MDFAMLDCLYPDTQKVEQSRFEPGLKSPFVVPPLICDA